MTSIVFYEKPGCINNAKQKRMLLSAGHVAECRNLLTASWEQHELREYFGNLPVKEWFNKSASAIKNGDVDLESINESRALELMLGDPLLIRRPLMRVGDDRRVGFDAISIHDWIGLGKAFDDGSNVNMRALEECQRDDGKSCEISS